MHQRQRHQFNSNLHLHHDTQWNNLPVLDKFLPLSENYLQRIHDTLSHCVSEYPRTCAIRFDLRFPEGWPPYDTKVISRFIDSLKEQIAADLARKHREGKRVSDTRLRYVWVKERDSALNWHYHVAIFINRDAYFTLGKIRSQLGFGWEDFPHCVEAVTGVNMADRIVRAWASALGCYPEEVYRAVHFPKNCVYKIDRNSLDYNDQFQEVFRRLSYFAKADTKHYDDGSNWFGCSRG